MSQVRNVGKSVFTAIRKILEILSKDYRFIFNLYCRLQPHVDTRAKQIAAWKSLVLEYYRIAKQAVVDIREVHTNPLFNNASINSILLIYRASDDYSANFVVLYLTSYLMLMSYRSSVFSAICVTIY